jgi:uncharacterized protein YwgA
MTSINKLLSSLKELGVEPSIETFQERKRNQKLAYLLQQVGAVKLGYDFSWYIRGPYSPQLTHDLYAQREFSKTVVPLSDDEKIGVVNLKKFLRDYVESPDALELLISLHFLRALGKQCGKAQEEVMSTLREKKPFFSAEEIERAWRKLDELERY